MGTQDQARGARIEIWLAAGGTVLASSERAARSVVTAFHQARRASGLTAWPTPAIFAWESWVQERWQEQNRAGLMLLNPLQEQALWAQVIGESRAAEDLLHPGRLASAAQQAYRLLCGYSPRTLKSSARSGWTGDPAIFSEWLNAFEIRCRREAVISGSRLALELATSLEHGSGSSDGGERPPLLLVGFDRLTEAQKALWNAWGDWRLDEHRQTTTSASFFAAPDAAGEVAACVHWLRASLTANPEARLMVVTTALRQRRGELERALLNAPDLDTPNLDAPGLDFEFSLGVPLSRVSLARGAILLLRWLHEPLTEPELDWLLTSGLSVANAEEEISLAETMRELRRRGQEQPDWKLADFALTKNDRRPELCPPSAGALPFAMWAARLVAAQAQLHELPSHQSPLEWSASARQLLDTMGWPGFRPLASTAFQASERWEKLLDDCASLGFDGTQRSWPEFVQTLAEAVSTAIFAPESTGARIQITEPLESAGQLADGIWFLGAHEENWPGRGQPHPLLPIGLQRESGMPHATPQADWHLAQEATQRLLASADHVIFSYARHSDEAEARPSRLVKKLTGPPQDWAESELANAAHAKSTTDLTETIEDTSRIPYPRPEIGGGAATLTRQSLCPFQAFATNRLAAEDWQPAEAGLNPKQRGQLLHAVLHRVWAGSAQGGISTLVELQETPDLQHFVRRFVRTVFAESFDPERRNSLPARFPARYLQLEADRLTHLVCAWLECERGRLPFTVAETEARRDITIAGLKFHLRLDRVDELQAGGNLIIDYKSGEVGPSAWDGDRPDDVQLPLYAAFAVEKNLAGLVFARVRPGDSNFYGRVRDAAGSLLSNLNRQNSLVKDPLTDDQLAEWRYRMERLAGDFLAGHAAVDPKLPGKTCESCHLHAVCRIYENQPLAAASGEDGTNTPGRSDADNPGGGDA
jgi:probable DNA repair protein